MRTPPFLEISGTKSLGYLTPIIVNNVRGNPIKPHYLVYNPQQPLGTLLSGEKYRIPRFHYKSSTDVGLKGDLGLLVMTRQLVVYILLFVGWVSTNSTSRCISQYQPWIHLSPVYAFRPITMANMISCDPALPIICKVNESLNPYIKSRIPQSPCPSIKLKTNSIC